MVRAYLIICLLLSSSSVYALDKLLLSLVSLDAHGWQLQDLKIALTDLRQSRQQLSLGVSKLNLPKPFQDISLVNIHCADFAWPDQELICKQGTAQLRSKQWQSPSANFSFHIKANDNALTIKDLRIAGGKLDVTAQEDAGQWQVNINGAGLDAVLLGKLLPPELAEFKKGRITIKLQASGKLGLVNAINATLSSQGLSGQTQDGRLAGEAAGMTVMVKANRLAKDWQWQTQVNIDAGAVYLEPVYLEAGQSGIHFDGQGVWQESGRRLAIQSLNYHHGQVGNVQGHAELDLNNGIKVANAQLSATCADLEKLSEVYLAPFFAETALAGISVGGQARLEMSISKQAITALSAVFNQVSINDGKARISAQGGNGIFNWAGHGGSAQASTLAWQKLSLGRVPIDAAKLVFLANDQSLRLLKPAVLPLLDGSFTIKGFSWQGQPGSEPDVTFAGDLHQVSLEKLTTALNWTPLSGTITGAIPQIQYSNKTLSLGGELLIKVFDGEVKISNLAASGLFTALPKFYSDVEINNLDMDQLTGKFKFGGITGKLSGYVRQLYLENWQAVSFYAWFGTPDDDSSKHRISQKAVNNIASIGGGGASDLVSRSVLGLFETFGYEKIGMGCYLHAGVCQLMGLEATPLGYYIIKGGGLPRIDVIGYNPRVDWNVLLDRLKRISSSDEVIVK